ncbi:MAG: hypothetical protein FWC96_05105 [Oscillospiraceae bacterium]|nr:hypothetical protein [Oscillospiraceae bacterium]
MYNRYIGNTGKVYRVNEPSDRARTDRRRNNVVELFPKESLSRDKRGTEHHDHSRKKTSLFGLGNFKFLEGGLPLGLELSDLVILALLFFLFLESGDEEFLIILGFLAYSIFKDHRDK